MVPRYGRFLKPTKSSPNVTQRSTSVPHHASAVQDNINTFEIKSNDSNKHMVKKHINNENPRSKFQPLRINHEDSNHHKHSRDNNIQDLGNQNFLQSNSIENIKTTYDNQEYTKALLQHQRERKERLQRELSKNKLILESLKNRVQFMEKNLGSQKSHSTKSLPSLEGISEIRNLNRQLEIDCNCMSKELDLIKKNSGSSRNFYEIYEQRTGNNPSNIRGRRSSKSAFTPREDLPPAPPPPPEEEVGKWRCSHCTFDNHAALNKCEMCEHAREVPHSRFRMPLS